MPSLFKRLPNDIGKSTLLHAVLIPKKSYTMIKAREWLKTHNYTPIANRNTENFYRFRIRETVKGLKFYTQNLNNGIKLVYMF